MTDNIKDTTEDTMRMEAPRKLVVNHPKEEEQEAMSSMRERRMEAPGKLVMSQTKEEEQEAMTSMREKRMETPGQLVTDRRCENPITTGPGALHSTYIIQDYNTEDHHQEHYCTKHVKILIDAILTSEI